LWNYKCIAINVDYDVLKGHTFSTTNALNRFCNTWLC